MILANGKSNSPDSYISFLLNTLCRSFTCLQSIGFQPLAPEALAVDIEHSGVIKDSVKGAEQRIFLIEVLSPQGRTSVAGEDDIICPFLVVPPVDEVEEQPSVLLVELTVPDLVNIDTVLSNQLGRAYHRWSLFVSFYIILCHDQVYHTICCPTLYLVVPLYTP